MKDNFRMLHKVGWSVFKVTCHIAEPDAAVVFAMPLPADAHDIFVSRLDSEYYAVFYSALPFAEDYDGNYRCVPIAYKSYVELLSMCQQGPDSKFQNGGDIVMCEFDKWEDAPWKIAAFAELPTIAKEYTEHARLTYDIGQKTWNGFGVPPLSHKDACRAKNQLILLLRHYKIFSKIDPECADNLISHWFPSTYVVGKGIVRCEYGAATMLTYRPTNTHVSLRELCDAEKSQAMRIISDVEYMLLVNPESLPLGIATDKITGTEYVLHSYTEIVYGERNAVLMRDGRVMTVPYPSLADFDITYKER